MATKKKKKHLIISNHPATIFLNYCYQNIKAMVSDVDNIYESLELLHKEGKHQRSHLSYLTTREIYNFIKSNRSSKNVAESGRTIFDFSHIFSVALGWKQFQQVSILPAATISSNNSVIVFSTSTKTLSMPSCSETTRIFPLNCIVSTPLFFYLYFETT